MSLKGLGRKNRFSPRRKPAKYGNTRHGTQILRYDCRTREGRTIRAIEAARPDALGGNPSSQQVILIQRASVKALSRHPFERPWLDGGAPESLWDEYLRWSNSLPSDLQLLGLERRAEPVQSIQTYLKERGLS